MNKNTMPMPVKVRPYAHDYRQVTTVQGIRNYLGDARVAAFDFETAPDNAYREDDRAALDPARSHIVGCSFSVSEHTGIYVPVAHLTGPNINEKAFFRFLEDFLTGTSIVKIAHNMAFESQIDQQQIPLIQEMLGYFLVPVTRGQKCFVIVGEGGAGKSVLLLVLNDILLGKANVSNVSWQALNERFKTAELFGKLANIFADLPTKNIDDNGIFKVLVGEDFLTVEKKNRNPFSFQCTARLLFSCNNIPKNYGDRSEGFYRRLIIIRFDHPVPENRKDPELLDKLRLEADGIFLFALEGLKRLIRNHYHFSETEANKAELQQYREDSDSVLSFVKDCCLCQAGNEVGSTELFNAYKSYCEESGMKPYAQNKFIQQVLTACPGTQRGVDKLGRKRILQGLRIGDILG